MEKNFDYKNMHIENNEELKYVMDYYDIPFVPIYEGNKDLGKITKELQYVSGLYKYQKGYEHLAFELAYEQVKEVIELQERLKQPLKTIQVFKKEYNEWEYPDVEGGLPRHHVYPRTVVKREEKEIEGATMDEVFEKHYKANRSYRYCNGYSYYLKDEKIQKMYYLWLTLMPEGRKFHLYYGNSIVD